MNIWDNCNLLEIVSMPSSHGTYVASIAAANFPDNPDRNGCAPGAQVVSVSIGDGRLGSMETGKALCRAMSHVMRAKHYKVSHPSERNQGKRKRNSNVSYLAFEVFKLSLNLNFLNIRFLEN